MKFGFARINKEFRNIISELIIDNLVTSKLHKPDGLPSGETHDVSNELINGEFMKKLILILAVVTASNAFAGDCKIKVQKMNPINGATTNQGYNFSVEGTEPKDEIGTFALKPYRTFIYEAKNQEECNARAIWYIEQYGKNSLKFLATEFENEKSVITDKHISSKLLRVANQSYGKIGGYTRHVEITDSCDPEYKVSFYR